MKRIIHILLFSACILCLAALSSRTAFSDVYDDVARATGGKVTRMTKDEFKKSVESGENRYAYTKNAVPLFVAVCRAPKEYAIPIDPEIMQAVFELKDIAGDIGYSIISPSGETLKPNKGSGDARLPVEVLIEGKRVVLVPSPVPGKWKFKVGGTGNCAVSVRGQTRLSILTLRVVRVGGRPGHEGLFPYDGPLAPGAKETLELSVYGAEKQQVSVKLIGEDGGGLCKAHETERTEDTVYLDFKVPDKPFRILISGKDAKGFTFQRIGDRLYIPDNR